MARETRPLAQLVLAGASMLAGAIGGGAVMYNRMQQLNADHAVAGSSYIESRQTAYEQTAIEQLKGAKERANGLVSEADAYIRNTDAYKQGMLEGIRQAKEIIQEGMNGYKKE